MLGEIQKCIVCGKKFRVSRMRECTCSNECAQEWVNRRKAEREKRMYPEIECGNRIPDEKQPGLFRCKATGYLCSPTERKPYERFQCLFEPQYMKNKRVQRTLKIIKTIEPGMMVSYLIRTKGDGYLKYKISSLTMKIREILPDGRIILEAMVDRKEYPDIKPRTEWRSIHDFYDVLHVDEETFKEAMQKALEEDEQQEEERKMERSEEIWE